MDDDSESDDGIVASEPRGARRQVNRATTRVSTHKRKLNAGDHIMYMNTLEGTAGSAKALRKTRILQILKDGSIKLENKQEYIFTQDPTLKVTVVRGHGSKKDRKKNRLHALLTRTPGSQVKWKIWRQLSRSMKTEAGPFTWIHGQKLRHLQKKHYSIAPASTVILVSLLNRKVKGS